MKNVLKLALVGRPNVGKSALFNRLCKKNIAIVDEAVGVTRDRLYAEAEFFGKPFQVIDTGGIDPFSNLPFGEEVRQQAEIAIEEADVLVMVVDARVGITSLDEAVAKVLLKTTKPIVLAVNKVDHESHIEELYQFYSLGIKKVVPVSAVQAYQIAELLEAAFAGVTWPEDKEEDNSSIKVAIVGRPNVGKSTLVNFLLDADRCVVSPEAGTTRDSIDVEIIKDGQSYTFIDTAGIRRKKAEHEVVDKFAAIRTKRAIERADICIMVLDATKGMTTQEKRIADHIEELGKGCILLFNKWDLVKGFRMEHCLQGVRIEASFLNYCPALFVSALSGRNVLDVFPVIKEVHTMLQTRITTGQLNKFVERVLQKYLPPVIQGKRLRIYYMAQVGIHPHRFIFFVNYPELMLETYKKYMLNQFREEYKFTGVPLFFELRGKGKNEEDGKHLAPKKQQPQEELFEEDVALEDMPDMQEELDASYFN